MSASVHARLSVVIVNYGTAALTIDCLNSVYGQLDPTQDEVVVVDNASKGDDVTRLRAWKMGRDSQDIVRIVPAQENRGFSAGNNLGISAVHAHFYLLANSDTVFLRNSVQSLLDAAERFPGAGLIGPRLESLHGAPQVSCFRFPSIGSEFISGAATGPITRALRAYNVPLPPSTRPSTPQWTSFACVLVRDEVFERVGLLDDSYFMYFEDVDFCRRTRTHGYEIVHWPTSRVVHLGGQSSGIDALNRMKKRLPPYYYNSRTRYWLKSYGVVGYLVSNVARMAGRIICIVRELLSGRAKTAPRFVHRDIWVAPARIRRAP